MAVEEGTFVALIFASFDPEIWMYLRECFSWFLNVLLHLYFSYFYSTFQGKFKIEK